MSNPLYAEIDRLRADLSKLREIYEKYKDDAWLNWEYCGHDSWHAIKAIFEREKDISRR